MFNGITSNLPITRHAYVALIVALFFCNVLIVQCISWNILLVTCIFLVYTLALRLVCVLVRIEVPCGIGMLLEYVA